MLTRDTKLNADDVPLDEEPGEAGIKRIENAMSLVIPDAVLYIWDGWMMVHGEPQTRRDAESFYEGYKMGWEDYHDSQIQLQIRREIRKAKEERDNQ